MRETGKERPPRNQITMRLTINEVPTTGNLAQFIMLTARQAPRFESFNKDSTIRNIHKLCKKEHEAVRTQFKAGESINGLARQYKVSPNQIRRIIK